MVIKRRSKSCATCLRRRKGCDKQRPSCGQCRKACLSCEGYNDPHGLIFINTSTSPPDHSSRPHISRFRSSTPAEKPFPSPPNDGPLAARAVESAHIDSFWRIYMPYSRDLPTEISHHVMGGWLLPVQALCRAGDPLLRRIMLSIAMAAEAAAQENVGQDVQNMRQQGLRLYGEALAEVSRALLREEEAQSDRILGAVKLFSMHESHYGSADALLGIGQPVQARNWLSHIEGQVSMTLSRTPASFVNGASHCSFVDSRLNWIFASLVVRKPTPMSHPSWLTVPWTKNPKTPRDHLVDIFANVTSAVGSARDLLVMGNTSTARSQWAVLLEACASIDHNLDNWNSRFGSNISGSLPPERGAPVQPTISQLAAARLMSIYWMTGMILEEAVRDLFTAEDMLFGETADISLRTDTEECFRRLIRLLPIFFEPAAGEFRMCLAATPMLLAMRHLEYLPEHGDFGEERAILARCMQTREGRKVRLMVFSLMQA